MFSIVSTMFIFSSWYWSRYYYVYLPFIAFPLVLNCAMIASIAFFKLRNTAFPEKLIEPDHVEDLVYIMPCYNETFDECSRSLDSLVNQTGIDDNKKAIMVVCDGRVRGPGMEKTTADYLLDDIFVNQTHREKIKNAYQGWNGDMMDIEVSRGSYKGVPYFCIVKDQNQGKRDSLIVVRSFLYKYNTRHLNPTHIFSTHFFHSMSTWLGRDVGIENVDHLVGMDADTIFDTDCISELLKESKYPNTVGVCGYVVVDFSKGNWNPWFLYQNAEYTIAQGLRRLHQSIATKKVSCLPGCCQLLRICEYTCGDKVLVQLFGYHPMPLDGMLKQIRATASEDRNHVRIKHVYLLLPSVSTRVHILIFVLYLGLPHAYDLSQSSDASSTASKGFHRRPSLLECLPLPASALDTRCHKQRSATLHGQTLPMVGANPGFQQCSLLESQRLHRRCYRLHDCCLHVSALVDHHGLCRRYDHPAHLLHNYCLLVTSHMEGFDAVPRRTVHLCHLRAVYEHHSHAVRRLQHGQLWLG